MGTSNTFQSLQPNLKESYGDKKSPKFKKLKKLLKDKKEIKVKNG